MDKVRLSEEQIKQARKAFDAAYTLFETASFADDDCLRQGLLAAAPYLQERTAEGAGHDKLDGDMWPDGLPNPIPRSMREPAQAQPSGDVIERMIVADFETRDAMGSLPTPSQRNSRYWKELVAGMTAALAVAREGYVPMCDYANVCEALTNANADRSQLKKQMAGMVPIAEVEKAIQRQIEVEGWGIGPAQALAARVRARLSAKEKVERVTLHPTICPHRWQSKADTSTCEIVVYCELCDWEYSRTAVDEARGKDRT